MKHSNDTEVIFHYLLYRQKTGSATGNNVWFVPDKC
jgi:hypothetical protein